MHIANDIAGIEQSDKMLREVGQGIHPQVLLAEPDRARFGDAEGGADDADVKRQPNRPAHSRCSGLACRLFPGLPSR